MGMQARKQWFKISKGLFRKHGCNIHVRSCIFALNNPFVFLSEEGV